MIPLLNRHKIPCVTTKCILQIEDDLNDILLVQQAFEQVGITSPLHTVTDGEMAIDYFSGTGQFANRQQHPMPCLVLLDLKLPKKTGLEVLQWIRQQPALKRLVVVLFSNSALPQDVNRAYELGANSYIQKPPRPAQLREVAQFLKGWWLGYNHFAPIADTFRAERFHQT